MEANSFLNDTVKQLQASHHDDEGLFLTEKRDFPSRNKLDEIFNISERLFFPYYWKDAADIEDTDRTARVMKGLYELFFSGLTPYNINKETIDDFLGTFFQEKFVEIRDKLKLDIQAAYAGDPAAKDYTSIIRSYPGFQAIMMHRIAHEFYQGGNSFREYARELSESLHRKVGIDIHPGAKIGNYFFIDHGTGVVVGETAVIGDWVRLYQNVTLGVLHFQKEDNGDLKKDYKRHPTLGNHVVVGANADVLGNITIGDYVNIGANSTVKDDVLSGMTVYVDPPHISKQNGKKKN